MKRKWEGINTSHHNRITGKDNAWSEIKWDKMKICIKRDFLKHETVKTNDKIQRFGVVIS